MKPFNLHGLKTYELQSRPSKVFAEDLGRPVSASPDIRDFLDSLPRQLASVDLRRVRDHLVRAHGEGRRPANFAVESGPTTVDEQAHGQ